MSKQIKAKKSAGEKAVIIILCALLVIFVIAMIGKSTGWGPKFSFFENVRSGVLGNQ